MYNRFSIISKIFFSTKRRRFFTFLSVTAIFQFIMIAGVHAVKPVQGILGNEALVGTILILITLSPVIWWFTTKEDKIIKQLKASVDERETLLKEMHHRVKNNLQIIASLIKFQSLHTKDAEAQECLNICLSRLQIIGMVHQRLYKTDQLTKIDFNEYITTFTQNLILIYGTDPLNIHVNIKADDIYFNIETAIPCGLLINELVSNCLKHAFPEGKGTIDINLSKIPGNKCRLVVKDDGKGINDDDFKKLSSYGFELINALTSQINGELEINREKGTEFMITFSPEYIES
jgi:two-component sensor histidine kinase